MYFQNVINTSVTRGHNYNRIIVIILSLNIRNVCCSARKVTLTGVTDCVAVPLDRILHRKRYIYL